MLGPKPILRRCGTLVKALSGMSNEGATEIHLGKQPETSSHFLAKIFSKEQKLVESVNRSVTD